MSNDKSTQDPLEFIRGMWGNMGFTLPGMITPTLDVNELDKRITDLKAVEHWLKVNLNMLQMTTQGLEMQRATLATMQAMSAQATARAEQKESPQDTTSAETPPNPFAQAAALWPWNLVTPQTTDDTEEIAKTAEPKQARRSSNDSNKNNKETVSGNGSNAKGKSGKA